MDTLYSALYLAQTGFTIWMLIDALRRQVSPIWFFIILTGVGTWAYFFAVKLPELQGAHAWQSWSLFQRRSSIDELRYQTERVPTLANHLALGERLIEDKHFAEAMPHLQAAQALEPEHCQVLFGLATCHAEQGHPEKAVPLLEQILAKDRRWSDYAAWRLLIRVRAQTGDADGALAKSRDLARLSPTLQHNCLLAEGLVAAGKSTEAQQVLTQALETHRFAPSPSRRRNRRWARQAHSLQKRIGSL
jgi:hypothetical protein